MESDIITRFEKLERENRRMKKIGAVIAVLVCILFVSGQAKSGNKIVEANEFRLVDPAGKVRAEIFFPPDSTDAKLLFRDPDGSTDVELGASSSGRAYLNLGKQQQAFAEYHISLDAGGPDLGPMLTLGNLFSNPAANIILSAGKLNSISVYGSAGRFFVGTDDNSGGPSVRVEDKEGYSGVIGRTDLETLGTGRKTQTPAASLVLFGKDKKVLWSAP